MTNTTTFEAGKTYGQRSICDSNSWTKFVVVSRTAKMITVEMNGTTKKLRTFLYEGVEQVKPNGSYSMCAVVGADDLIVVAQEYSAKPVEMVKPNPTFVEMIEEGRSLFTEEQFGQILDTLAAVAAPVPVATPATTAKVYNFADYRR